jgi:hypothetical protein
MWGKVQAMSTDQLRLDIESLKMIAGYAHWIPITRGIYKDFLQRYYPGWEWNQIIPALIKKGIVKVHTKDPEFQLLSQGLYISREIEAVTLWIKNGKTQIAVRTVNQEESER